MMKNLLLWVFIAIILIAVFSNFGPKHPVANKLTYSEFVRSADQGEISNINVDPDRTISGTLRNNENFVTYLPAQDQPFLSELVKKGVNVTVKPPEQESMWMHIFISWFPMLLL